MRPPRISRMWSVPRWAVVLAVALFAITHLALRAIIVQSALKGRYWCVRLALSVGVPPDVNGHIRKDWYGTPLHAAAYVGDTTIVQLLLDRGARTDINTGGTPLHRAADMGHVQIVRLLLENGADPNAEFMGTPLDHAVERGRTEVCTVLREYGGRETPSEALVLAARQGDVASIRRLLNEGANPNRAGWSGRRPLELAITNHHPDVAALLLKRGAHVLARDLTGGGALHCAAQAGDAEVIDLILDRGADPDTTDRYKRTPLHLAADHGQLASAKRLLRAGCNVDARDAEGATPLGRALGRDDAPMCDLLRAHGGTR